MRHISPILVAGLAITIAAPALGQTAPVAGIRSADMRTHAIVGAKVVTAPGQALERATVVIRDGVIVAVGPDVAVPPEARSWPADGLTVYAGLIDAAVFMPLDESALEPAGGAGHWNERIHPQLNAAHQPWPDASLRRELRDLGFTAAAVYPDGGTLRGSGAVISLGAEDQYVLVYSPRAAMGAALEYGGFGADGGYPRSLMGAIALLRQTFHDARWHAECTRAWESSPGGQEPPPAAEALDALATVVAGTQPVLFDVSSELDFLRAAAIAEEFQLRAWMLGSGLEFRRLAEIAALKLPVIVPLRFPERPDVGTLAEAEQAALRDMINWEQGPTNARRLLGAGVSIALTTARLERRSGFPAALRKAIDSGLAEDAALAALTTVPAGLLGVETLMGTVEPGKVANLVVVEGSLFERRPKVRDVWVNGRRHEVTPAPGESFKGEGQLVTDSGVILQVDLDTTRPSLSMRAGRDRDRDRDRERGGREAERERAGAEGAAAVAAAAEAEAAPEGEAAPPEGQAAPRRRGAGPPRGGRDRDRGVRATSVSFQQQRLLATIEARPFGASEGFVQIDGVLTGGTVVGNGAMPDGSSFTFTITPAPSVAAAEEPAGDVPAQDQAPDQAPDAAAPPGEVASPGPAADPGADVAAALTAQAEPPAPAPGMEPPQERPERPDAGREDDDEEGEGDDADREEIVEPVPEALILPLGAYGLAEPPQRQTVAVVGAVIWTEGPAGIIEDGALLVADGAIEYVGPAAGFRPPEGALVIDGEGRHVTPGLIDCHSHTGISGGVNEASDAITAEVRIGDVINPDDVNFYHQLAGGLTAANQLHGSANPIGGQNSVIKLKWGGSAESMRIADAVAGIKFALGENVKRSTDRYPNTRMGVETLIRDAFTAARDYAERWQRYLGLSADEQDRTMPPRRDLELEALVEILEGRRLVHCHSYRQDEILALLRIADDFGFTVGTLQHVLEGYKVAEAIAAHGAGASTFSDWWAYKVEVMDAIPYNGALMHDVGVVVSFNSDSSELARRMNFEAAKAVRYGGLEPHEALKFVTINPAKQLRIDLRTGSLEKGKDGDFVIWSQSPLSTYSRCEQTWIEGARYFDVEADRALREQVRAERARLVQKILRDAQRGGGGAGPGGRRGGAEGAGPDAPDAPGPPGRVGPIPGQGRRPRPATDPSEPPETSGAHDHDQDEPYSCCRSHEE